MLESHTHQDGRRNEPEGEERRERRSRDRYGRDRRERQPRDETAVPANDAVGGEVKEAAAEERTDRPRYPTGFVTEETQATPQERAPQPQLVPQAAPEAPRVTAAQAPAPAAAAVAVKGLPKVQAFELPVSELAQVAEGSGLQWVNSDAQKIAAVQAQIAAEPRPPRVPRERPAAIVIDEGPLVLVETKRDLQGMKLPFEQGTLPLQ